MSQDITPPISAAADTDVDPDPKAYGVPVRVVADGVVADDVHKLTTGIAVASLPLASGAATEAKQDAGNASLSSIDAKTPALGQALAAASVPSVLPAAQEASLRDVSDRAGRLLGHVDVDSAALPVGAATSALQGTTFDLDTGAGTQDVAGVSLRKSASGGSVELGTPSDPVRTDPTGTTTQPVSGTVTLGAGSAVVGHVVTDSGSTTAVSALPPIPTGSNTIGKVDQGAGGASAWKVDGSAVTQPVSAASLPLPAGAATSANQATEIASLSSIDGKLASPALPGDADSNSSLTQVIARLQAWTGSVWKRVKLGLAAASDSLSVVQATDVSTMTGDQQSQFYPAPSAVRGSPQAASIDPLGTLQIRGPVLTDEESFRDDFKGSSLLTALTGSLTFTNGQAAVTGSGTAFTTELTNQSYVRLSADANSVLARVSEVVSNTALVLEAAYTGSSSTGAAVKSNWQISTPAGGSITVGSSLVNLVQSTTNGDVTSISRVGDYLPEILTFHATVSQRIANQNIVVGLVDALPTPNQQAVVLLSGTDSSKGVFRTSNGSAAADTESTQFLYPSGLDSSKSLVYEIDLSANEASLRINGSIVAVNTTHLPDPYQVLKLAAYQQNTGVPASATTLSIDVIWFQNVDAVNVERTGQAQPLPVRVAPPIVPDATRGIIYGRIDLSAITTAVVRSTTYTEQVANFTGSIVSSSASDAAAGTGARTVRIVYYDVNGNGPFVETVTLNGTTSVPLTATDKCFIERISVLTVGSGGVAAGNITLRNDAVAAVGSIALGNNQTFWAHHYVAAGKTAYVLDLYHQNSAIAIKDGSFVALRSTAIGIANAAERLIADAVNNAGATTGVVRTYPSQIPVAGPAKIFAYVTTLSAAGNTFHCSFTVSES